MAFHEGYEILTVIRGEAQKRIYQVIRLGRDALRKMGIEDPKIAVAGLNPHAGESGLFGREEVEEIGPAIQQAQREGLRVEGPLPADTVFSKMPGVRRPWNCFREGGRGKGQPGKYDSGH